MLRHQRTKAWLGLNDKAPEPLTPSVKNEPTHESPISDQTLGYSEHPRDKQPCRLSKIVEQRTLENGQLRQDLAAEKRKSQASKYLQEEVRRVTESLQQVLINFQNFNDEFGEESRDYVPQVPARYR
jgi:hypothetical protein